jgi:hypothetical protein
MSTIWMGIAPRATTTSVVVMTGPTETILKATLSREPSHPRALPTLLEAIALWEGAKVRAALGADERRSGFDSNLYRDVFGASCEPLFEVDVVPLGRVRRDRRREVRGLGDMRDARQLVLAEAWR